MRRWSLVCLLSLGVIIAYVDRTNLSVSLADASFKKFFQLDDTQRGLLNSVFFWSYALLQIPAGFFVDRFGVKYPMAIGFGLWCLVSAATGATTAVWQLITLRLLLGVFESVVTPGAVRWVGCNIEERRRGLAMGIYMAGTKFGSAVGAKLATWLLGIYGWRQMFVILGLGGLAWLIPWLLLARNDDRQIERAQAAASTTPIIPFAGLFRTRVMWGILIGTFCYNYFAYFCMTWLPAYLVERRGLSMAEMGTITSFSFGGMATVAIIAGFAADWLISRGANAIRTRRWFTIAGFLVASTEMIGALSNSKQVAVAFAIISLSGLGLATANYWALTQALMRGAAMGGVAGAQNMASNLAGVAAPLLTGWLKSATADVGGGYVWPMRLIWVFLLAGVGAYVFLVKEPKTQMSADERG